MRPKPNLPIPWHLTRFDPLYVGSVPFASPPLLAVLRNARNFPIFRVVILIVRTRVGLDYNLNRKLFGGFFVNLFFVGKVVEQTNVKVLTRIWRERERVAWMNRIKDKKGGQAKKCKIIIETIQNEWTTLECCKETHQITINEKKTLTGHIKRLLEQRSRSSVREAKNRTAQDGNSWAWKKKLISIPPRRRRFFVCLSLFPSLSFTNSGIQFGRNGNLMTSPVRLSMLFVNTTFITFSKNR